MIKLYETDSYIKEFSATVISSAEKNGYYEITLDKTAFFPEGGGQSADKGTLDGIEVIDVFERDGEVIHKTGEPIAVGKTVEGKLDFETRFSRMQSHAGEHIVSGVVHSLFGYNNVGFHMSESTMTVDFDGTLAESDVKRVEEEANLAVWRNMPITVSFPDSLDGLNCRSKIDIKEGIRIITIEGVDVCACCAPHPRTTGEIGIIKILSFMSYKKGTRIEMTAGRNAYRDYAFLNSSNKALMSMLSAKREETVDAVKRLSDALQSERAEKSALKKKLALLSFSPVSYGEIRVAFIENVGYDELRYVANEVGGKNILLSKADEGHLYVVSFDEGEVSDTVKVLNTAFNGKGGGKGGYAQGKISEHDSERIVEFIKERF